MTLRRPWALFPLSSLHRVICPAQAFRSGWCCSATLRLGWARCQGVGELSRRWGKRLLSSNRLVAFAPKRLAVLLCWERHSEEFRSAQLTLSPAASWGLALLSAFHRSAGVLPTRLFGLGC